MLFPRAFLQPIRNTATKTPSFRSQHQHITNKITGRNARAETQNRPISRTIRKFRLWKCNRCSRWYIIWSCYGFWIFLLFDKKCHCSNALFRFGWILVYAHRRFNFLMRWIIQVNMLISFSRPFKITLDFERDLSLEDAPRPTDHWPQCESESPEKSSI